MEGSGCKGAGLLSNLSPVICDPSRPGRVFNLKGNEMDKKWIVVDLDGTLVGTADRDHLRHDWDAFHEAGCNSLDINRPVEQFIKTCHLKYNFLLLTGRSARYKIMTIGWLSRNDLLATFDEILMRADGDYRPDGIMKIAMLEEFFGDKQSVIDKVAFCLEDRQIVIDAFREFGLPCWEVVPGGY